MLNFDLDYAKSMVNLSEQDIRFGLDHGLVTDSVAPRLQHLFPIARINLQDESEYILPWLYISISCALENASEPRDLFDEIDMLFAEFDYPEDLKALVSYMPSDEKNPTPESLVEKIKNYHSTLRQRLRATGKIGQVG